MRSITLQGKWPHSKLKTITGTPLIACRYSDDEYEYRHVQLPKNMLKAIPKEYHDPTKGTLKLLWEEEWRALGITQVRRSVVRNLAPDTDGMIRVLDGSITKFMSRNRTYFSSSSFYST